MSLYLGIDGGGTGCRAAIADAAGRVLGRGQGGPANINSDPFGAVTSVLAAATAAMAQAGASPADLTAVLGLAG
ncbi:BadF/BadG/BcrA/BcrD ATPase family protein, partial [Paracoccus marcusii]